LGSTKSDSSNEKLVRFFKKNTEAFFKMEVLDLTLLPYFNPDLEHDLLPNSVVEFRQNILDADGILICTPEYVFSIPGVLKNAIEWTVSTTIFNKKPTAIITAATSGEMAHESIQLIMNTIGADLKPKCMLLIQSPKAKINEFGDIIDEQVLLELKDLIENFKNLFNLF
jgi:chromate reductase, NAD(P)H dehydrogenase (quinone)